MLLAYKDMGPAVRAIINFIGEDPNREGLVDTPLRVAKAWREMTSGYDSDPKTILARDFHGNGYDQMVVCKKVEFTSVCEHHMLPFMGHAWVGYIPRKRVVGLSKMARLVDCFARRLQIQENMTRQIADAMQEHLNPLGVGVRVEAVHCCMSCRGVMKRESSMVTTALLGAFRKPEVRAEFLGECR